MQSVSSQIDRITIQLEKHKDQLTKDVEFLDQLYQQNKTYFDNVTLYLSGSKKKDIDRYHSYVKGASNW